MGRPSTAPTRKFRHEVSTQNGKPRTGCLKQVMTSFNIFFMIAGLGVLGVGLWIVVDTDNYSHIILSTTFTPAVYLLILAGCLVIITSAYGFVGLCKLHKGWMIAHILLLLLVCIIGAAAGVLAYLCAEQTKSDLQHRLREIVVKDYGNDSLITDSLDSLQKRFTCCGSVEFRDWQNSSWGNRDEQQANQLPDYIPVPDSCCRSMTSACGFRSHPSNIYYDGCTGSFAAFLRQRLYIIGGVGIGICAIQLCGAVLSCCLLARLKKSNLEKPTLRYDYTRPDYAG